MHRGDERGGRNMRVEKAIVCVKERRDEKEGNESRE